MSVRDQLKYAKAPTWPVYKDGVKGDMLTGLLVNRSTRETEFGTVAILTILPDEPPTVGLKETFNVTIDGQDLPYRSGPLSWQAMGTVAKREVEEQDPQVGDEVGLLFEGQRVAQKGPFAGKTYEAWTLVVKRASGAQVAISVVAPALDYDPDGDEEPF